MGKTEVIDLGWNRIIEETKLADRSYTKVGLQEGEKAKDMSDLVVVGAANEFGTKRIPARPFIRSTYDDNREQLFALIDRQYGRILDGVATAKSALARIGSWLEARTKKKIVDIREPPNAPSTARRKALRTKAGRSDRAMMINNPLIDTGQMRQAIRHVEVMV